MALQAPGLAAIDHLMGLRMQQVDPIILRLYCCDCSSYCIVLHMLASHGMRPVCWVAVPVHLTVSSVCTTPCMRPQLHRQEAATIAARRA